MQPENQINHTKIAQLPTSKEKNKIDKNSHSLKENNNHAKARSKDKNIIKINNESNNAIKQSGNSDVDVKVNVHVDTTAIAFALLCSLLATRQMSKLEFDQAVKKLEELNKKRDHIYTDDNNLSNVKIFNR